MNFETNGGQDGLIGRAVVTGTHNLAPGLFDRSSLAQLLRAAAPEGVRINTMGYDPADTSDWAYVDPNGESGEAILDAVARGRLWVNVLSADRWDPRFAAVRDEIRDGLVRAAPHLDIGAVSVGVLVSSPEALVHYHADPEPNMLFQVAGRKRVWVYPALDPELSAPAALAEVFAGGEEELPYRPGFDARAEVVELTPGAYICWPQNSPHRIINGPLVNISLTVSYHTPAADRRILVWAANRWFHRRFHLPMRPEVERGIGVSVKVAAFRAVRKAGLVDREQRKLPAYRFRVDPTAELGRS
jgi:hypothetical protein